MARNRMINPEFWLDEDLAKLSPHARLLYIGLWAICDDNYATLPFRPEWIKAQIFPYEEVDIRGIVGELSGSGKVIVFPSENKDFLWIKNFFKYQRVEKPSKPKYPEYKPNLKTVGEESGRAPAEVKISKEKRRDIVPNGTGEFSPYKYIESLKLSPQRHITIIGKYMHYRGMEKKVPTKKAAETEMKRHLKAARELAEYPDDRIKRAWIRAVKLTKEFTLDTILKEINK